MQYQLFINFVFVGGTLEKSWNDSFYFLLGIK